MSSGFFIVGTIIFLAYTGILFFVIGSQHKKQRENKSELDIQRADTVDMDGHGNWGRFVPETKPTRKRKHKKKKPF